MLDISIKLVIIALVVVCALLILLILMQRPKQEGLGAAFGSGMTDAAWGARTTDVLQKGTVYLGTAFFVFCLVLSILTSKRNAIEGRRADAEGATAAAIVAPATEETSVADEIDEFEKAKKAEQEATEESTPAPVSNENATPEAEEKAPAEETPAPTGE